MWSSTDTLEAVTKAATWVAAVLGVLAGVAGFVAVITNHRADQLKETLRRTPPDLEVTLEFFRDGTLHVVIDSKNRVPFECQWKLVTKNNIIVSGIPLDWSHVYPDKTPQGFNQTADLDPSKIVDNYVELRFNFRSIYAAELRLPQLSGRLTKAYYIDLVKKELRPA